MTVGTAQYDGATFKTYQDNVLASSSAHTLATGNSAFRIGGGLYSAYNYFNGDIAEVLVYSGTMSETDRAAVGSYLRTKYSTEPAAVPEPGTLALMGLALAALACRRPATRKARAVDEA